MRRDLPPEEQQAWAIDHFDQVILNSNLLCYNRAVFADMSGCNIVLIVATYSISDLCLLDRLDSFLSTKRSMINIYAYDVTRIVSMSHLDSIIPNIGNAYQTPMIGIWEGSKLMQTAWGNGAIRALSDVLHIELP